MSISLRTAIHEVSRYSISIIGLLYTCGLIIVNTDLAFFGLASLDLARPEYVLAGVLWAFLSLFLPLAGLSVPLLTRRGSGLGLTTARIVLVLIFGLALPFLFTEIITATPPLRHWGPATVRRLLGVAANCGIMSLGGYMTRVSVTAWQSDPRQRMARGTFVLSSGALLAFLGVVLLVLNLTFYAVLLYPDLPKKFGGGSKPRVLVILSEPTSVQSGLPLSEDGRVIGPVAVLLEASTAVALVGYADAAIEQRRERYKVGAVSIEKKHISALIYLK